MKIKLIQPSYPQPGEEQATFEKIMATLNAITEADLIVLPEGSNAPGVDVKKTAAFAESTTPRLLAACADAARRCHALVCVNGYLPAGKGLRNRTLLYTPDGNVAALYDKTHLTPGELTAFDGSYLDDPDRGLHGFADVAGLRFGFVTCYDIYFDEYTETVAARHPDIIFLNSYQRWETANVLQMQAAHLAHKADAFVLRTSWYRTPELGGNTLVASPDGTVEALLSEEGVLSYEFDPKRKRTEPKNQGMHYREDRHPQGYLPAGPYVLRNDDALPYPRLCAHRGFNTIAPENSMPAFGAAVALGADEIEFDLWATKDGELVSIHDASLDRVSNGTGHVWDYTLEELRKFDFGCKKGEHFSGLSIITFEEILQKFACTTIMNIHMKIWDMEHDRPEWAPDPQYEKVAALLRKYGCERHVYMMSTSDNCLRAFHEVAPEIHRCVGWDGNKTDMLSMADRAIVLGAEKIQLFKPYYSQETIDKAHANGILCNLFFADDPEEACRALDAGVDTILTNDYLSIANATASRRQKQ